MASTILRPSATLQTGSVSLQGGAGTLHGAVGDASDTTRALCQAYGAVFWGNSAPAGNVPVVAFADATGTLPAGRTILSVQCVARVVIGDMLANGTGYGMASFRYSDNVELENCDNGGANPNTLQTINGQVRTSATRYDGGTSKGAWTYALVDGIKGVVGMQAGASQSSEAVVDLWLNVVYTDVPAAPTAVTPASGATVTVPNPTLGGTMSAIATGQSQKMEWQFATDSGFTTNVKTVTEASGDLRASGATTESPTIANLALSNGTWWIRGRAVDQYGLYGPYSTGTSFTVSIPAVPAPTAVTPASGATVTTMTPTLGGTITVDGAGRLMKMEWQLATDSGFTANVRSVIELDADFRASGATTEVVPLASKLTSNLGTTWYIRGRAVGNDGTTSSWTTGTSFTLSMAAPATPTAITPANGATVTSNTPTLGATLGTASENRTVKAQWQLATDSGFTANVRTITENDVDLIVSGATTEVIPGGSKLFQTLWYMRCREIDQYGQAGAYSANQTFTVAHQPTASPTSPVADTAILYAATTPFSWSYSDPAAGDLQTAYQIIVERNDTNAVVLDSTKVASAAASANLAISSTYKDIKLRWKIRVWDSDDVVGNYSPYQLFTLSDLPVVTITAPTAGQQIITGQPTVTWSNDAPTTQVSYRLVFKKTSDNSTIYDTGTVASSVTTYTTPVVILENLTNYSVTVTVTDQYSMVGTASRSFSTLYQVPDPVSFTVDASGYETLGYINIDWSATTADGFFVDWRVYRKLSTDSAWELVYVTNNQSITNYHDWTATTGDLWQYAVTQTAGRSGAILESVINGSTPVLADGTHYWLINPLNEADNIKLSNVNSDSFSDDYEEQELIVIGRGRKMNHGTRIGYTGELQCQLRDDATATARQKRMKLQILKEARTAFYLRNPFGDVLEIAIGNLSISRIAGVGTSEFVDVTIPYREVF